MSFTGTDTCVQRDQTCGALHKLDLASRSYATQLAGARTKPNEQRIAGVNPKAAKVKLYGPSHGGRFTSSRFAVFSERPAFGIKGVMNPLAKNVCRRFTSQTYDAS